MSQAHKKGLEKEILEYIKSLDTPVNISHIARKFNLTWPTARQLLFELCINGKIVAKRTTGSWIFEVKTEK